MKDFFLRRQERQPDRIKKLVDSINKESDNLDTLSSSISELTTTINNALDSESTWENRFYTITESISDAVISINDNGYIISFNNAAELMFGRKKHEVIGSSINTLLMKSITYFDKKLQNSNIVEDFALRNDGTKFPIEMSISRIEEPNQNIYYAIIRDITDRKEYERKLIDEKNRFRDIVENSQDLIWQIDENFNYEYVAPAVKKHFGYTDNEVIGMNLIDLLDESSRDRMINIMELAAEASHNFELIENIKRDKNNNLMVYETSGTPIYDNDKHHIGYRGVDRNITERKRNELHIRESESLYRALFDLCPSGIVVHGIQIKKSNPAFYNLIGCTNIEGNNIKKYIRDVDYKELRKAMAQISKHGGVQRLHLQLNTVDGPKNVEISCKLIRIENQKFILSVVNDLTPIRQINNRLTKITNSLQKILEVSEILLRYDWRDHLPEIRDNIQLITRTKVDLYLRQNDKLVSITDQTATVACKDLQETFKGKIVMPIGKDAKYGCFYLHSSRKISDIVIRSIKIAARLMEYAFKRHIQEEHIEIQSRWYNHIFEFTDTPILIHDMNKVISANLAMCTLLDVDKSELVDSDVSKYLSDISDCSDKDSIYIMPSKGPKIKCRANCTAFDGCSKRMIQCVLIPEDKFYSIFNF